MSETIETMIDIKGRLDFEKLRRFAQEKPLSEFLSVFELPLLVSRDLYVEGMSRSRRTGSLTLHFIRQLCKPYLSGTRESDDLSKSVFMLHGKEPGGKEFRIGRSADCDIVLSDISISKEHAVIQVEKESFYITDCGSTNGTMVEHTLLEKGVRTPIVSGTLLSFGRFEFVFTHPMMVYRAFYRENEK